MDARHLALSVEAVVAFYAVATLLVLLAALLTLPRQRGSPAEEPQALDNV